MIYKQLLHQDKTYDLPKGSKILSAQLQDNQLTFWYHFSYHVTTEEEYEFIVVGTGHDTDVTNYTYLSTVQQGSYVWRIFYRLMSET